MTTFKEANDDKELEAAFIDERGVLVGDEAAVDAILQFMLGMSPEARAAFDEHSTDD